MPFETKMTSEQAIEKLKNLYGTEITTADIKAFCAMNDITYQTVTKKLQDFKSGQRVSGILRLQLQQ